MIGRLQLLVQSFRTLCLMTLRLRHPYQVTIRRKLKTYLFRQSYADKNIIL